MNCYIGENLTQVLVEMQPQLVKAQDTTNDSFQCVLKANTDPNPIKPMTPFKVVYDDNTSQVFWVSNDSVTVFSLNPKTYKHSLTLVQYRYFLNKHILRNTVFNQPRNQTSILYSSIACCLFSDNGKYVVDANIENDKLKIWYDTLTFRSPSKVKSCILQIKMYAVIETASDTYTFKEITYDDFDSLNLIIDNNFDIRIKDGDNLVATIDDAFFDFKRGKEKVSMRSICSTINNYLSEHPTATLKAEYYLGQEVQDRTQTFVKKGTSANYPKAQNIVMQFSLNLNVYNYSMYDVLDTLLKQHQLKSNSGSKREKMFNLPTANSTGEDLELYNLLTTTYPPDTLSFTQATWYDVLSEIFRFYDAGFKFDENKMLKIEYYNDLKEEVNKNFTSLSLSQADKNYCDKRVLNYQNANQQIIVKDMPTRSSGLGVPQKSEFCLVFPKPIYELEEVLFRVTVPIGFGYATSINFTALLDLTPFIFNHEIWSLFDKAKVSSLLPNNLDFQKDYQQTTLFYDRGSNVINLSTYFKEAFNQENLTLNYVLYRAIRRFAGIVEGSIYGFGLGTTELDNLASNWEKQRFDIRYQVLNSGKFATETITNKYNGEMLVNQNDGLIDINKVGLSMFVESLKDGEPILTASCEMEKWENRIQEGDYFVDNNGFRWVANVISYTILPNGNIKCSVEFSKNFNMLSLRVHSDKEKRLTTISRSLAVMSEDTYIDYIYVTDINSLPNSEETILSADSLGSMVAQTFNYSIASFTTKSVDFATLVVSEVLGSVVGCYLPLSKYGAGNCVCFEMQFDDPISAGNQLVPNQIGWWAGTSYFSQAVKYTDDDGWRNLVTIDFCENPDSFVQGFPSITQKLLGVNLIKTLGEIRNLEYYKKPNEIFALNYEWCFLPLPNQINDFFIGNKFISLNAFVKRTDIITNFYLRYTTDGDFKYSVMDIKGEGEEWWRPLSFRVSKNGNVVILEIIRQVDVEDDPTQYAKTWSIVDENGDIYFASNHPQTFDALGTVKIYFVTKNERLKDNEI